MGRLDRCGLVSAALLVSCGSGQSSPPPGGSSPDASFADGEAASGGGDSAAGKQRADASDAHAPALDGSAAPDATDGGSNPGDAMIQADAPGEGSGPSTSDPCSSPDPGNSDPARASQYVLGTSFTGCVRDGLDKDYIAFTTPANHVGGYVVVTFANVGQTTLDSFLYLASNTNPAYSVFEMHAAQNGDGLIYWFGAAPSTGYVIRVQDLFGSTFLAPYAFSATFTAAVDPLKPNDSRGSATPIVLGTPVQSLEFHGYTNFSNSSDTGWWSFYQVMLADSPPATVSVTNVPAEIQMDAYVYGNSNEASILGYGASGTDGASFTFTTNQPISSGPHYVFVEAVSNPVAYGAGATPASYVLHPYTLLVTQ
ncbi:MAG: hypothetical protein JOZ69_21580 [Myxococcales bacterium]|nr:hypothetical protein [Myxococcales bacterium]